MASRNKARIISLGSYLPSHVLNNQDFEKIVETTDEWIVSRTGIKERRLANVQEFASDMGLQAAVAALDRAQMSAQNIDLILVATMSPDYISPSTASLIQAGLDAFNAAAFDIQAACTGFIYALSVAKAFVDSGTYQNVLVVATEKMSAFVDYKDRNTCVLFGDGAAAALVSNRGEGLLIGNTCLGADGSLSQLLVIPAGGARHPTTHETVAQRMHYIKMSGRELFKHAVRRMSSAAVDCLAKAGLKETQLSWLVPHQANLRIIDAISTSLGMSTDKVYKTLHKYGNTSASSMAIALDELTQQYRVNAGDHILLAGFGAGLTWGAALLTKIDGNK